VKVRWRADLRVRHVHDQVTKGVRETITRVTFVFAVFLGAPITASAEIYKLAVPTDYGFHLYWWPVLPSVVGWHHDEIASRKYATNVLVPDGYSFLNAPAITYGEALYKPRDPEARTVEQVISNDRSEFDRENPGIKIKEVPELHDGDGKALRCFSFGPAGSSGNWELVAYSEEGDDFLLFTVSALSSRALQSADPTFSALVSHYREKP